MPGESGEWKIPVKYFFLSDGWSVGRVWEVGGLWSAQRPPEIRRLELCLQERGERLCLYCAEEAILMLEVHPPSSDRHNNIGQVTLKRLMSAEQAIERLAAATPLFPPLAAIPVGAAIA